MCVDIYIYTYMCVCSYVVGSSWLGKSGPSSELQVLPATFKARHFIVRKEIIYPEIIQWQDMIMIGLVCSVVLHNYEAAGWETRASV